MITTKTVEINGAASYQIIKEPKNLGQCLSGNQTNKTVGSHVPCLYAFSSRSNEDYKRRVYRD